MRRFKSGIAGCLLAILGALTASSVHAQTIDTYELLAGACRKKGDVPESRAAFEGRGGASNTIFRCNPGNGGAATGASALNPYPAPNGPCNQATAQTNIDWVFADSGARRSFERFRAPTASLSPVDAVMAAQNHNRSAQQSIVNCRQWAEAYLAGQGQVTTAAALGNRKLSQADCRCISVLPAAGGYNVVNNCDAMKVQIGFEGKPGPVVPNSAPPAFPLDASRYAGVLYAGRPQFISSPNWAITSIRSAYLENAGSQFTCVF